ncbi:hypothetical protein [uncultured Polaribacter sp.]
MKDENQSFSELDDFEDSNDSEINFFDICSIIILIISTGFLLESIVF